MKGSFHIADWEVEPRINAIKKDDQSFHVEPKVMQVLVELASHSNEVLSKEQLIQAVWSDTFVSDDVLTRCISEIRRVLNDDPRAPKYIQTVPKSGYRLIAPVVYDPEPAPRNGSTPSAAVHESHPAHAAASLRPLILWAVVGLLLAIGVAFLLLRSLQRSAPPAQGSYRLVPFTSYPGAQTQPAFSPDGNQIAFVWDGENANNKDIYVKMIGTETPLRLTSDPAADYSPAWSPDGRFIAFLRFSDTERGVYIVPALGGAARKVFSPLGRIEWERGALSWSPDGKRLIFPDGKSSTSPSSIYALDLISDTAEAITHPPKSWDGDISPVFSPDGSKIAFVRAIEGWVRDVYVMNANGGEPVRLTSDGRLVTSLTWTPDGQSIIFSSNRAGKVSLWRIAATGGPPERLAVGTEDASGPAVSRKGNHLAYVQGSSIWEIRRIELKAPMKSSSTTLLSSTQEDSAPKLSPDGSRIAFQSLRSGTQEVWLAAADGSNPVRLTSIEKSLTGSPSWSPDGQHVAFDARPEGHSHIYSIGLDGARPRQLTDGDFNDILPSWSRSGQSVYFGSNRSGSWQIWKVPAQGGPPQQVTKQGGFLAQESFDGKWVYFAKSDAPGVWRIPASGGDEQKILDQPAVGYWGYWSLTPDGIFFLDQDKAAGTIDRAELTGDHRVKVHQLERPLPPFAGLTVSPDEHTLLYNDSIESGSHITLVEGFHY